MKMTAMNMKMNGLTQNLNPGQTDRTHAHADTKARTSRRTPAQTNQMATLTHRVHGTSKGTFLLLLRETVKVKIIHYSVHSVGGYSYYRLHSFIRTHPRIPAFEAIYTVCHSVQPGRGCPRTS